MSKTCPGCGAVLNDDARFCGACGTAFSAPAQPVADEQATVAAQDAPAYQPSAASYEQPAAPRTYEQPAYQRPKTVEPPYAAPQPSPSPVYPATPVTSNSVMPAQAAQKPKKKVALYVINGIVGALLIAAITVAVIMIIKNADNKGVDSAAASSGVRIASDAGEAYTAYDNAWIKCEFREYYTHNYYANYLDDDVESSISNDSSDYASDPDDFSSREEWKVAEIVDAHTLTKDATKRLVEFLKDIKGCHDTDKIQEAAVLVLRQERVDETKTYFETVYGLKINNVWYFVSLD